MRQPSPRRLWIVVGLGAVALASLPTVIALLIIPMSVEGEVLGWSTRITQLAVVGAVIVTILLLRRSDFAPLRRARDEYAANHRGAVVETVSFDPLWMPQRAGRPRNPSQRTYGLIAADAEGLTAIEEGTVILAAGWGDLSVFGPGPAIAFTHGDEFWSITPIRRNALSRLARH